MRELSTNSIIQLSGTRIEGAFPSSSSGRIEYPECDFFFSKVSSIDWWTGTRTWPTFNATASDNRSWDGIDCDAQKVITNFFTGEYYVRFSITK